MCPMFQTIKHHVRENKNSMVRLSKLFFQIYLIYKVSMIIPLYNNIYISWKPNGNRTVLITNQQYGTLSRLAVCTSIDWNQSIERQICLSIYWLSFAWLISKITFMKCILWKPYMRSFRNFASFYRGFCKSTVMVWLSALVLSESRSIEQ